MDLPILDFRSNNFTPQRLKEFNTFDETEKAKIVYYYLFRGFSHRELEEKILNKYNHGFAAMNILHHYGITLEHKKIFKDLSLERVIKILKEPKNKQYTTIRSLLETVLDIHSEKKDSRRETLNRVASNKKLYPIPFQRDSFIKESSVVYDIENEIISEEDLKTQLQLQKDIGSAGEQLVLAYYIEKVKEANIENHKKDDLIREIIDVSQLHGHGYDIEAWDLDTLLDNEPQKIFIEVKTTTSQALSTPFYLSINEAKTGIQLGKRYRIGRIINFNSQNPKYFEIIPFKNVKADLDFLSNLERNLEFETTEFKITKW